jgi:hypothetical protein
MYRAQRAYSAAVTAVDLILDSMLRVEGPIGGALDDTVLSDTLRELRSDVSELARSTRAESKNVADQICAFLEDVVPYLLSERFRVEFAQDGDRIQDAWLRANSGIEQLLREGAFVKENGKTLERKASRQLLSALVDCFCNLHNTSESEEPDELMEVPQIVSRLNRVYSHLLNPATHELGETTEKLITVTYSASLDQMFSDARQLCETAVGLPPRMNPFQALNQTILWLLKRADEIPPSGRSLTSE